MIEQISIDFGHIDHLFRLFKIYEFNASLPQKSEMGISERILRITKEKDILDEGRIIFCLDRSCIIDLILGKLFNQES